MSTAMLYCGRPGEDGPEGRVPRVARTGISVPHEWRLANSPERHARLQMAGTIERDCMRARMQPETSASGARSASAATRQSATAEPQRNEDGGANAMRGAEFAPGTAAESDLSTAPRFTPQYNVGVDRHAPALRRTA